MKVESSSNFSKKEVNALYNFCEEFLGRYSFKGVSKETINFSNLVNAINLLPKKERENVYLYLSGKRYSDKYLSRAVFSLRTIKLRFMYDQVLIACIRRATDYQNYELPIVLGYVRLYDSFSGCLHDDSISKEFTISKIEHIVNMLPSYMTDVLDLHYGLIDGRQFSIKKVSRELNLNVETCKQIISNALILLRNYC